MRLTLQILHTSSHRERPNTPAREMEWSGNGIALGMEWAWNGKVVSTGLDSVLTQPPLKGQV